ncbi:MAG: RNase adapter RapZ [Pyramidobacter sp.]|nr:RNase adapter RapZ [Pyramidobacter sp.]
MLPKKLLIVTGLSGSGKSCVLDFLEDQGFFTVDNLPVSMLPELLTLLSQNQQAVENGVGVVVDARSSGLQDSRDEVLAELKRLGVDVQVLFLEASEDALLRRYNFTRRRHPMGFMASLVDGIKMERHQLRGFRILADKIIDTSNLSLAQLRGEILFILGKNPAGLQVTVSSFGYKYGVPQDADFMLDVRFLANPYYEESLRHLSGKDEAVRSYIYRNSMASLFLRQSFELFESILPVYHQSGKNFLHIAVGCTGGRHRSVFVAEWLGDRLGRLEGIGCIIKHRDMQRDGQGRA